MVSPALAGHIQSRAPIGTVVFQVPEDMTYLNLTYKLSKALKNNAAFSMSRLQSVILGFGSTLTLSVPKYAGAKVVVQSQYMGKTISQVSAETMDDSELNALRRSRVLLFVISRIEAQSEYDTRPTTDTISMFYIQDGKTSQVPFLETYMNLLTQIIYSQFWTVSASHNDVVFQAFHGKVGCAPTELRVMTNTRIQRD